MKKFFLTAVIGMTFCGVLSAKSPYVLVLGTAQDAGAPQMGCMSAFCVSAWKNPGMRVMVSSIALVDPDSGKRWIFDATPDLPAQFQLLKEKTGDYSNGIDGIFLTHAHIGHYTGLMYLGKESINSKEVPVYVMPRMKSMLTDNAPWSQLVSLRNIKLNPLKSGSPTEIVSGISVEPFLVPHRDEFSETVGFRIVTRRKSLVFIPDIDKWSKWGTPLEKIVGQNDYILIDGTFYKDGEIPRPMSEVPHPFVAETMELLSGLSAGEKSRVYFIHFNHSNPLIQGDKSALVELKQKGFKYAVPKLELEM